MDALILSLLAWIAANTELSAPPPRGVQFVPHQELVRRYFGLGERDGMRLEAMYDRNQATIVLSNSQSDRLSMQSKLLHELVHHVQRVNETLLPCPEAYERQAYTLQANWLHEKGVKDPYKIIGMDEFTMIQLTACPDINAMM